MYVPLVLLSRRRWSEPQDRFWRFSVLAATNYMMHNMDVFRSASSGERHTRLVTAHSTMVEAKIKLKTFTSLDFERGTPG